MNYLVVDHLRLSDLLRQDTPAETPADAQQLAADMARRYGVRVYVLGVVGMVECPAKELKWVRPVSTAVAA